MNRKRKFIVILLILLVGGGWLIRSQMSTYVGLNSEVKVAQICAITTKKAYEMDVSLTLFDSAGKATSNNYPVRGDTLRLRGDIIKPFTNFFVLYSGYKLVALEGHYQDHPTLEPDVISLNGGDDILFTTVQGHPTPLVQAVSDSSNVPVNGNTYNVFVSQNTRISPVLNAPSCNPKL